MSSDNLHRPAHFTAFLTGVGYHESAWKLADPADLDGPARFGVLERAALDAERVDDTAVDDTQVDNTAAGGTASVTVPALEGKRV
jgi:hypothetical protein